MSSSALIVNCHLASGLTNGVLQGRPPRDEWVIVLIPTPAARNNGLRPVASEDTPRRFPVTAPLDAASGPHRPTSSLRDMARSRGPLLIAGAASLSAGFVHAAASGAHSEHPQAMQAFAAAAMLQFVWCALILVRPSRRLALIGCLLNAGLVI